MSYKFFFFVCALNLFYYVSNLSASPVNPVDEDLQDTSDTYKYHVSIQRNVHNLENPNSGQHFCSGAIIRVKHILTASHCFMIIRDGHIESTVQPGSAGVAIVAGISPMHGLGIIRKVLRVFIPYEYDVVNQDIFGDIAILELTAELNVRNNRARLQIVPLDIGNSFEEYENKRALVPGNSCRAIHRGGNGVLHIHPNPGVEIRQVLDVDMLHRSRCRYFHYAICARTSENPQLRACVDGGSPLVYGNRIIGVLSHQENDINGIVFTRVWRYIDFINSATNEPGPHPNIWILNE